MRVVSRIGIGGFFVEDVLLEDGAPAPPDTVETRPPEGFYRPMWTGSAWAEGKPAAEIVEEVRAAKSWEMRIAAATELKSHTQAISTDEAISSAVVKFYSLHKTGGAPPAELESLAALHAKLKQKLTEVATSPDPGSVTWV